mgnify:CR=1 FL=1
MKDTFFTFSPIFLFSIYNLKNIKEEKKMLRKGQIVWAKLDGIGSEQKGIRPCIVVQNNTGNRFGQTTIVVPLTSKNPKKLLPTHLLIRSSETNYVLKDSIALTEQIKIIDKSRITQKKSILPKEVLEQLDRKLLKSLGIAS